MFRGTKLFVCLFLLFAVTAGLNTYAQDKDKSKKDSKKTSTKTIAIIKTSMGTIEAELFKDKSPKTVENFVGLAKKKYYDGLIFHRIIDKFMIQGGDPTGTGMGGESFWGGKFKDELDPSLKFDKPGYLAMANSGPNTNGSQFFITVAPTTWLNGKYSMFGLVIKGQDVVTAISKVKTKTGDRPVKDVVMEKVTIEER